LDQSSSESDKVVCIAEVLTSQININAASKSTNNRIILATAIVYITDINGTPQPCRAVIDSGAEISLITATCAKRLQLPFESLPCPISGIGMINSKASSVINAKLSSRINNYYFTNLQFHVLNSITNKMPHQYFDVSALEIPESIKTQLADPDFNIPGQIDILLGAEVSYSIFNGQKNPLSDCAILHHTSLGWVLAGKAFLSSVHTNNEIPARHPSINSALDLLSTKPTLQAPLMAPLPRARVTMERPFVRTGVDFCCPIQIRSGIRKVQSIKSYIAVFVCFVTRAIHLELVSDLTTSAFMAALFRFMSRRGQCAHMYSDNGTNFVGADKELTSYFKIISGKRSIQESVTDYGIQWHFIPPAAPHFGGLWEAAVKSTKAHLIKMSGSALLNFEEMATLLCRIEAVLNSRPLTPASNCPSDYTALTPAHFLVGGNLLLPPEPDCPEVPRNKLQRWKLVCGMAQGFWRRWSKEYLPQLVN